MPLLNRREILWRRGGFRFEPAANLDIGDQEPENHRQGHFQQAGKVVRIRVGTVGSRDAVAFQRCQHGHRASAELGEPDDGLDDREADEQVDQLFELRFAGGNGCQKDRQRHQEGQQGGFCSAGDQCHGAVFWGDSRCA
jgi:hypothetical protein